MSPHPPGRRAEFDSPPSSSLTFEREGFLRLIADSLPALVAYASSDLKYRFVNRTYEKWFKVPREHFIGRALEEVLGPKAFAKALPYLNRALQGESPTFEITLHRANDEPREVEGTYIPDLTDSGQVRGFVILGNDITDRKRAQESLRTSEERFRALFEQAPFSIQLLAPDGRTLQVNQAWKDLWGISEERIQSYILNGYNVLTDPQLIERGITPFLEKGIRGEPTSIPAIPYDPLPVVKSGRQRWVGAFMYPLKSPGGMIQEVALVHTDVTAQVEAQAALKQSEKKFRDLAESIPHLVWALDAEGNVDYANHRWEEIVGMSYEEAASAGWKTIVHPDDLDRVLKSWAQVQPEGRPLVEEYRIRRKDGVYRWVLTRCIPIRDSGGKAIRWFGTATDIDDQKRAQGSFQFLDQVSVLLAASLDFPVTLQSVADLAANDLADWCTIDFLREDGTVETLALSHRDPRKRETVRKFRRQFPIDLNCDYGPPRVFKSGKPHLEAEVSDENLASAISDPEKLRLVRELGLKSAIIVPLKSHDKVIGTLTLISADVHRRYDERDLALAIEVGQRASLAIENARLYSDLKSHEASLKEAVVARDEFLSIASHELKTPLTSLKLQAQLSRKTLEKSEHSTLDRNAVATLVTTTERQVDRLSRLVDDMLDISRIAHGKLRLEPEDLDLGYLVRDVVDRFAEQLKSAGCKYRVTLEGSVTGHWDRYRIEQVVTNLLTNAIKYSPGKPVEISVTAEDHCAVLRVRDHGKGIAPENLERIFERFERATSGRGVSGLGLGLYISRQIVESHGGRIFAQSRLGQGATFTVQLPLKA